MPILPEKSLTYTATFIGLIVTIFTAYFAIDSHYAKAAEMKILAAENKRLEMRLDQKIVSDRSDSIQQRIWKLEDRYPDRRKAPPEIQEMWRQLEKELTTNDVILQKSLMKNVRKEII
jgi:hypothetical protein